MEPADEKPAQRPAPAAEELSEGERLEDLDTCMVRRGRREPSAPRAPSGLSQCPAHPVPEDPRKLPGDGACRAVLSAKALTAAVT